MRPRLLASFVIAALSIILAVPVARANGRFPQAQVIVEVPGSGGRTLFLRATFGILVSRDAGASFQFLCERAFGYGGTWDPPIAATRDGRLWVGLDSGLVSTIDGCHVTRAPELEGETVRDLTVDPAGDTVLAITGAPGRAGQVWRRARDGTWSRVGKGLPDTNVMTIEVAPSRPSTLYVTGQPYGTIRGRLYRSDDGGVTLTGAANALEADGPLFIAAVDPEDPSRVLLRHLHARASDLLITRDGRAFRNVLSMKSAMFGFAKTRDGRTYWAGSGLPSDGILRSDDRGEHFTRVAEHGVLCLEHTAAGLFACENPLSLGAQAFARSDDSGASWTPLGTFADVRGPVRCADADASAACGPAAWDEVLTLVSPRAPAPAEGADASDAKQRPPRRACTCGSPGTDVDPPWSGLGAIGLLAWARARSRRGSRRAHPGKRRPSVPSPACPATGDVCSLSVGRRGRQAATTPGAYMSATKVNEVERLALHLQPSTTMRKAVLVALVACVTVSAVACGDASSTGSYRGGIPRAGDPTQHDPNDVDLGGPDPGNPNASSAPPPVTDPGGQGTSFSVALSLTNPTVDLGADTTLDVTLTQVGSFTGDADLSAVGLPAGVTASFTPPKVTIGATPVTAKVTLTADYSAVPSAAGKSVPLQIMAKSSSDQTTANLNFKINPHMTLTIPLNVDALRQANVGTQYRNEWGTAFGTSPATLKTQEGNGIVVVVKNADSAPHIVHSSGAFPHGDTALPIGPNAYELNADGTMKTRTLSPTAAAPINVSGYPHDGANGPSVSFRIAVNAVP